MPTLMCRCHMTCMLSNICKPYVHEFTCMTWDPCSRLSSTDLDAPLVPQELRHAATSCCHDDPTFTDLGYTCWYGWLLQRLLHDYHTMISDYTLYLSNTVKTHTAKCSSRRCVCFVFASTSFQAPPGQSLDTFPPPARPLPPDPENRLIPHIYPSE